MKKRLLFVSVCVAMIVSVAVLAACGGNGSGSLSTENVYGLGAVSTAKLLGQQVSSKAVMSLAAVSSASGGESTDDIKEQADKFNEYFAALDSFLGEDLVTTDTEKNTDSKYPYETKMTINGRDVDGTAVQYIMYYTETIVRSENDGEEKKDVYLLKGVMIIDGAEYYIEGDREEETERDESESELKIRAYLDKADRENYVQMEQEYSVESDESETEYVYSVYSGNKLVEETAVEFETERKGNKVETEYELEFRKGKAKGRYSVEREVKGGKTTIKVKYHMDGKTSNFIIREIVDESGNKRYEYTFADGSKKVY